jgi:hypothetical protein
MAITNGGAPYNSYTPTISVWRVSDAVNIVSGASMTQIGTTAIYKYSFSTSVYGIPYVYLITGDSGVAPNERFLWGNVFQETPDRAIFSVVADGANTATTFKTDATESTADFWKDALCLFLSGTLINQVKKVTAYDGGTKFLTFTSGFTGAPSAADKFVLINF